MQIDSIKIIENNQYKIVRSENYNYNFDKTDGTFMRWGKTKEDDPAYAPWGSEILDLEISSGGPCSGNCKFCYKSNGGPGETKNMTFDEFKIIFDKMRNAIYTIELENGKKIKKAYNDKVKTKRGVLTISDLMKTDEIIEFI